MDDGGATAGRAYIDGPASALELQCVNFDSRGPRRRSIRLGGYDYVRPGAYFVTVCTHERKCLFGEVVDGVVVLNDAGLAVRGEWLRTAALRRDVAIDEFVVMPNHLHGVLVSHDRSGDPLGASGMSDGLLPGARGPRARSLGAIIAGSKSAATARVNALRSSPGAPLWHRNYYEHVVRGGDELQRIRQYIVDNPRRWSLDRENPALAGDPVLAPWEP
ncbi:MAG: uncharacterized protein JWM10_678 [Myxococcaceae bacterium]|nr:uncharacterized protein [Myxococcaceae bacterium]